MPDPLVEEAERVLARRDGLMGKMIERTGPCDLHSRRHRNHFEALTRAIAYQQLAGPAASAIYGRFLNLFDGKATKVSAEAVLATPEKKIRAAGMSAAKTASIRDLAAKVDDGTVPLRGISRLTDDAIVERLIQVRGIGRWTAEMFLMFQLGRIDVWPADDYGVRKGYANIYGLEELPKPKQLQDLGEIFRPYRSVAAWYCWRAVDTLTPGD